MSRRRRRLSLFGSGLDLLPETETIIAAMATEPSNARKLLINTLVGDLQTAGVWAKLDCLWVMAAPAAADTLINWKDPGTFDLTVGAGVPTFVADMHYSVDGTDDYFDTNFNPSTASGNYTQDSACLFIWNKHVEQQSGSLYGWFDGADGLTINVQDTSDVMRYRANQAAANICSAEGTRGIGLSAGNRSGAALVQGYKNGVSVNSDTDASTALNNATVRIGNAATASFVEGRIAAAGLGASLDATEQGDLYDALLAYLGSAGIGSILGDQTAIATNGATRPVSPADVYPAAFYDATGDTTWFFWEAKNAGAEIREHYVRTYNHTTETWTAAVECGDTALLDDDHGTPAACIDDEGYVHVFGGAHNGDMTHFVTDAARDPSAWSAATMFTGNSNAYPKPVAMGEHILMISRGAVTRLYARVTASLADGVPTWAANVSLVDLNGVPTRPYAGNFIVDGNNVLIPFATSTDGGTFLDLHLIRVETNATTHAVEAVSNLDDSTSIAVGSLPITEAELSDFTLFSHGGSNNGVSPNIVEDGSGNIHFLFLDGETGAFAVKHMIWNGATLSSPTTVATQDGKTVPSGHATASGIAAYWRNAGVWYRSEYNGSSWDSGTPFAEQEQWNLSGLCPVLGGQAEARVIFSETTGTSADLTLAVAPIRVWVHGDSGFLEP